MSDSAGVFSESECREARELVQQLVRAIRGHRLYEGDHPTYEAMLERLVHRWRMATRGGPLTLALTDASVLLEDVPLFDAPSRTEVLPSRLYDHGVGGLVFLDSVDLGEIRRFVATLAREPDRSVDFGTLLWEAELASLRVLYETDTAGAGEVIHGQDLDQQLLGLGDDQDAPLDVEVPADWADESADDAAMEGATFRLTEAEWRDVRRQVASDSPLRTVRHAVRVVHGLAAEDLSLTEALTLEKSITNLVGSMVRQADLEGTLDALLRVQRMREGSRDLEIQVAELTLALFLEPDNLHAFFRGLDRRPFLDGRMLGLLFGQLGASAAPEAAAWLTETRHPSVVVQALQAFGEAAARALVRLYQQGGPEKRERVRTAFLELGTPEVLAALAPDFSLLPRESRLRVLEATALAGAPALRGVVLDALNDPAEEVRGLAIRSLRSVDAPRLAQVLEEMFSLRAFDSRTADEVGDLFEAAARVGDGEVARVLVAQCPNGGLLGALRTLRPLEELCLRTLRRMRDPEARAVVDEFRRTARRRARAILDERADLDLV